MAGLLHSLTLATLVSIVSAQVYAANDPNNHFNFPPTHGTPGDYSQALQFNLGTQQQFLWNTNYSMINLYLWQDLHTPGETLATNLTAQSFTWAGTPAQNLADGRVFFLAVYNSLIPTQYLFYSQYFNITSPSAQSSSSTPSAATATTTVVLTTTSVVPATTSSTSSTSSGGSHVGLGVGVGVGVGGALLLLAGALWFFRKRRKEGKGRLTGEDYKLSERLNQPQPDGDSNRPFPRSELPAYQRNTHASELST